MIPYNEQTKLMIDFIENEIFEEYFEWVWEEKGKTGYIEKAPEGFGFWGRYDTIEELVEIFERYKDM